MFSILFGFSLMALGERGHTLRAFIDDAAQGVFGVIAIVMRAAPIGAFGAMAYTIGKFGTGAILNLVGLIATFYVTAGLFVIVVLGIIARFVGFSIFKFLAYIKDELLIVLGTSSSESALPSLMEKLERLGCSKSVVGLVVPTGYSFNLDGTNIYMTLATLFIAQALGFDLTLGQQITILVVAMLTSKGASGITGAGFITLAATLAVVDPAPRAGHGDRARHRQVHERVPRADQSLRQRRCLRRGVMVGRRTRSRPPGGQSQQAGRSDRYRDRGDDELDSTPPSAPIRICKTARFCRAVFCGSDFLRSEVYSPPPKRRDHHPARRGCSVSVAVSVPGSAGVSAGASAGSAGCDDRAPLFRPAS